MSRSNRSVEDYAKGGARVEKDRRVLLLASGARKIARLNDSSIDSNITEGALASETKLRCKRQERQCASPPAASGGFESLWLLAVTLVVELGSGARPES
jgi:hypothetical protein